MRLYSAQDIVAVPSGVNCEPVLLEGQESYTSKGIIIALLEAFVFGEVTL